MSQPAVLDTEWDLIREFYKSLDELHMEECSCCHERWLDMKLIHGRCGRCRRSERRRSWFAPDNNLDLGAVPDHLPELNDVEEMLIARAHVHVQVRQIRGQQYQYAGHTVCFMQNTQKIYNKLPLMPKDLNIILLKPASGQASDTRAINQSFERQFRVRRSNIARWLHYLKHNHPDYRNIEIDDDVLESLPDDGSIHGDLPTRHVPGDAPNANATGPAEAAAAGPQASVNADDNNGVDTSAVVPDLRPEHTEFERLRQALTRANPLSVPSFNQEPVSEFDNICILRMVFPTLFPNGQGDISLPRRQKIPFDEWIRHTMRYRDGRFGRHARFRYVVFNMLQRQKVRSQASWICREIDGDARMTLEDIQQLIRDGQEGELAGRISRQGANLVGTRPFWASMCRELDAMVRNLDCPHLFFTFSAADIQWLDLHVQMPDFPGREAFTTDPLRHRKASQNVTDNPHITAEYLACRFKAFFDKVMKRVLPVADYWYRFEWQQRGSGHIHGFLWLHDEPNPSTVDEMARQRIVDYWGPRVTAMNPQQTQFQAGANPASLPFSQRENTQRHLAESLNWFQRHKVCTPSYCQKKPKGAPPDAPPHCRFHYPRPHRNTPAVSKELNPRHWMYLAERNDTLLNAYHPVFTMGWMANTDMSRHLLRQVCIEGRDQIGHLHRVVQERHTRLDGRIDPSSVVDGQSSVECPAGGA
jgi:ATP-dependent DNA helicase PIF1